MDLAAALISNPAYVKRVNEGIDKLREHFAVVKSYLNQPLSDDNFDDAFKRFLDMFDLIPILKVKLPMPQIVRGRPHYPGDPLCDQRWQVSYNWRFQHKIKLGRFNQIAEPLFYASLPTESDEMDYVLSCALECCKELSIEYGTPDVQDITVSGWMIEKTFNVVILCFDDLHLSQNHDLKKSVYSFLETIHTHFSKEAAAFIEEFFRYFSELSRTIMDDNACYKILVPFFYAIRFYADNYHYQTEADTPEPIFGMIYPGAMSMAKGLNVVLTREAVKKFLRLDKIVMYRYFLVKPERTRWIADKCSDIIKVRGHKFKITNYIPQGR
jgi:hypothetical protein